MAVNASPIIQRWNARIIYTAAIACIAALAGCTNKAADRDKDGEISADERAIARGMNQLTPMKAGLWQVDVQFDTAEIPGFSKRKKQELLTKMSKAASSSRCLSKSEAINPPASFYGGQGAGKCRYRSFAVNDGKAAISLSCMRDNMATIDTDMAGISTETNFNFTANSALRLPMVGKIDLRGQAAGRYIGACNAK